MKNLVITHGDTDEIGGLTLWRDDPRFGERVALVYGGPRAEEEALLLAAAPAMLQALKAIFAAAYGTPCCNPLIDAIAEARRVVASTCLPEENPAKDRP